MANETRLVLKVDEPFDFIVSNPTAVEKGTIMKLIQTWDPRGAAANDGSGDVFACIARREKIGSDGRTRLSGFRRGIFVMTAASGPTIAGGSWVTTSGPNLIRLATSAEHILGKGIGIAMEDIEANTTGEVMVGGH